VECLTAIRLEKARILLEDPKLKVEDAAEMVGYSDERYFCTLFKKRFGTTPTRYRETMAEIQTTEEKLTP
jgi:two-component system response regulator YesN